MSLTRLPTRRPTALLYHRDFRFLAIFVDSLHQGLRLEGGLAVDLVSRETHLNDKLLGN